MASTKTSKNKLPLLKTLTFILTSSCRYFSWRVERMKAIWEGLYQSPGLSPYSILANLAMLWMEKGYFLS